MYAMLFGQFPFKAKSDRDLYNLITSTHVSFPILQQELVSRECRETILAMTSSNPDFRPTAKDLLASPWFSQKPLVRVGSEPGFLSTKESSSGLVK